jgi:phospholipid transport system substrate-binding protein
MTTHGTTASLTKRACEFSLALIFLVAAVVAPAAQAADDASGFITDLGRQAFAIMKDPGISKADRQHRFQALMTEDFDLPKIAQFVLGSHWQTASDSERLQFTAAFGDYMTSVYSGRFAAYSAPSFRVTAERAGSGTTTVVVSEITRVATGERVDLDWVVTKTPASYKVIDVAAGGVSLSRAQHEEFSSVVQRNGDSVPNLIRQLQMKSVELAAWGP